MKRLVLAGCALLLLCAITTYHAVPLLYKEPLLWLNRSLSGLEEKTVQAAGHRIHYLEGGAGSAGGTPVVLLHGIFAEKDHWVDFARPLTGSHRVIAPDLPGFGESDRLEGQAYDYAAHTERLAAWLDALGLPRVHLAGNSMGGTIVAYWAGTRPTRVHRLALLEGLGPPEFAADVPARTARVRGEPAELTGLEFDILLATTIVESGLDIPNANTLVVHHADHFGLAQLYQIRGRIGRAKQRAYALFTLPALG